MNFTKTERIIADFFIKREGERILKDIKKIDFIAEGMLDSLDIIFLATYIEEKFGKKIDITDEINLNAFRHFDDIVKLII